VKAYVLVPNLIDLQTDVALLPAIKGLLRNPHSAAHLHYWNTRLGLLQNCDHLFQ
jgi:hypothetical protein